MAPADPASDTTYSNAGINSNFDTTGSSADDASADDSGVHARNCPCAYSSSGHGSGEQFAWSRDRGGSARRADASRVKASQEEQRPST